MMLQHLLDIVLGVVFWTGDDLPRRTQYRVAAVILGVGLAVGIGLAIHHGNWRDVLPDAWRPQPGAGR